VELLCTRRLGRVSGVTVLFHSSTIQVDSPISFDIYLVPTYYMQTLRYIYLSLHLPPHDT
jgi:hypothetical protein